MCRALKDSLREAGHQGAVLWKEFRKSHSMVDSEEEMQVVMEFMAQHLDLEEDFMAGEDGTEGELYELIP